MPGSVIPALELIDIVQLILQTEYLYSQRCFCLFGFGFLLVLFSLSLSLLLGVGSS